MFTLGIFVLFADVVSFIAATSIIYAASELGQTPSCDTPPVKMYPFGEKPLVGSFVGRLPVPWNSAGTGFSNSADVETVFLDYITSCGIAETMESSLAAGRGPTMFNLTTSLARLRGEHPSLLWGDFKDNLNGTMVCIDADKYLCTLLLSYHCSIFPRACPLVFTNAAL